MISVFGRSVPRQWSCHVRCMHIAVGEAKGERKLRPVSLHFHDGSSICTCCDLCLLHCASCYLPQSSRCHWYTYKSRAACHCSSVRCFSLFIFVFVFVFVFVRAECQCCPSLPYYILQWHIFAVVVFSLLTTYVFVYLCICVYVFVYLFRAVWQCRPAVGCSSDTYSARPSWSCSSRPVSSVLFLDSSFYFAHCFLSSVSWFLFFCVLFPVFCFLRPVLEYCVLSIVSWVLLLAYFHLSTVFAYSSWSSVSCLLFLEYCFLHTVSCLLFLESCFFAHCLLFLESCFFLPTKSCLLFIESFSLSWVLFFAYCFLSSVYWVMFFAHCFLSSVCWVLFFAY